MTVEGERLEQYQGLHAAALQAIGSGDYTAGEQQARAAFAIAKEEEDPVKMANALGPAARALWLRDQYIAASCLLSIAHEVTADGPIDEHAAIATLTGRLATWRIVRTMPVAAHAAALRETALPYFERAAVDLAGHGHLYYRYANSSHGSIVAALADMRWIRDKLIAEGRQVAHQVSPLPYDQRTPAEISPTGLKQLWFAEHCLPRGGRTPVFASVARRWMVG